MKTKFKRFIISAKYINDTRFPNADKEDNNLHRHYIITVKSSFLNGNDPHYTEIKFNYYGSYNDYLTKTDLDNDGLICAFYNLLIDSTCCRDGFEEFCSNFGYDDDSHKAHLIFAKCKRYSKKVEKLGIYESELIELEEELGQIC